MKYHFYLNSFVIIYFECIVDYIGISEIGTRNVSIIILYVSRGKGKIFMLTTLTDENWVCEKELSGTMSCQIFLDHSTFYPLHSMGLLFLQVNQQWKSDVEPKLKNTYMRWNIHT